VETIAVRVERTKVTSTRNISTNSAVTLRKLRAQVAAATLTFMSLQSGHPLHVPL